jgi:hypothetical protein
MAQKIELLHELAGNTALAYPAILDLRLFGGYHPFMKEVKLIATNGDNSKIYDIKEETFLFGIIKMRPQYEATVVEIEAGKHIRYLSDVQGGLKLQIDFYFEEQADGHLRIKECVMVKGNFLLNKMFVNILKKAHLLVFKHIAEACLVQ